MSWYKQLGTYDPVAWCSHQQRGKQQSTAGQRPWRAANNACHDNPICQGTDRRGDCKRARTSRHNTRTERQEVCLFSFYSNHSDLRGLQMFWDFLTGGVTRNQPGLRKGLGCLKGLICLADLVIFYSFWFGFVGLVNPPQKKILIMGIVVRRWVGGFGWGGDVLEYEVTKMSTRHKHKHITPCSLLSLFPRSPVATAVSDSIATATWHTPSRTLWHHSSLLPTDGAYCHYVQAPTDEVWQVKRAGFCSVLVTEINKKSAGRYPAPMALVIRHLELSVWWTWLRWGAERDTGPSRCLLMI